MSVAPDLTGGQQAAFGALLAETVHGVVHSQRVLDADAARRVTEYFSTPQGRTALPPLWYTFSDVRLEIEMSATLTRTVPRSAASRSAIGEVQLTCRPINPVAVSLFGYAASSGFKVAVRLTPKSTAGLEPLAPAADSNQSM